VQANEALHVMPSMVFVSSRNDRCFDVRKVLLGMVVDASLSLHGGAGRPRRTPMFGTPRYCSIALIEIAEAIEALL
jgi:hypothetical protein